MQVQVVEKPLKYGTRLYGIGELVEMTDKHARLFMAIGRARRPKAPRPDIPASPSTTVTIVETQSESEAVTEQGYETQDMQAEVSEDRPKRRYRRRDLQAKE